MFSVWQVFTNNLNGQTSWLKVKFQLVSHPFQLKVTGLIGFRYALTDFM